eukprot:TRINITY_DN548_c0_g1_i24.p1 TRINITY_DN548_c0_g1~~TRINITY_DN548_c0_g1_i24.p1  ORF type:complete len:580 (-),score=117.08 TRINITY_DN548_c0_g1_i24:1270-2970(-)
MSQQDGENDTLLASVLDHLELGDDNDALLSSHSALSTPSSTAMENPSLSVPGDHGLDPSLVSPSAMWLAQQAAHQHHHSFGAPEHPQFGAVPFGHLPMGPQFHGPVSLDMHGNPIMAPMHHPMMMTPPLSSATPMPVAQAAVTESASTLETKENIVDDEKGNDESDSKNDDHPKSSIRIKSLHLPLPKKKFKRVSPKELADVIRLQLMNLMAKNPMDEDFYFQVYSARNGEPWKGIGFPGEKSTGFKENIYRNPDGTPKLPAGTLGRIAHCSAKKPRTLIQITSSDQPKRSSIEDLDMRSNMFITHSIPYLIEEGIRCLMNIEDVDGLLISSENPELYVQRDKLGKQLLEYMGISEMDILQYNPHHLLYKFAVYAKGRQLVLRSLLLLPQNLSVRVFTILLANLNLFANPSSRSRLDDRASDAFEQILKQCPPEEIVFIFVRFMNADNMFNALEILKSIVGSTIFKFFLKAGHSIRQNPHSPPHLVMEWINLYSAIFGTIPVQFKISALYDPDNDDFWENALDICMHANGPQIMQIRADLDFDGLTKEHLAEVPLISEIRKLVFDW